MIILDAVYIRLIGNVNDCDGAQIGDIDGNGKMDVATCESTGNPRIFWFQQGATIYDWTQYLIYAGGTKHEGIDIADYNGDGELEVISLDQSEGRIRLHKPSAFGTPTGAWDTVVLQATRPFLQDSQAIDIDGDGLPEIVYTWEGNGVGSGGINWLDWTGGDITNPANWTDHVMIQHEGVWWLASSGRTDLSENGIKNDIVFSSRDNNNPNPILGIYWIESPAIVTNPWTLHIIDNTVVDWLHCDVGDFSGFGHGKDVVAYDRLNTVGPTWYAFNEDWKKNQLTNPASDFSFNIRRANFGQCTRDNFLYVVQFDGMYLFQPADGKYRATPILELNYTHPMDDRIIWYDLDGDGIDEAIVPDGGGNRLIWLDFILPDEGDNFTDSPWLSRSNDICDNVEPSDKDGFTVRPWIEQ